MAVFILLHELAGKDQKSAVLHIVDQISGRFRIDVPDSRCDNGPVTLLPPLRKLFLQNRIGRDMGEFQRRGIGGDLILHDIADGLGAPFRRIRNHQSDFPLDVSVSRDKKVGKAEDLFFRLHDAVQLGLVVGIDEMIGFTFRTPFSAFRIFRAPVPGPLGPLKHIGCVASAQQIQPERTPDLRSLFPDIEFSVDNRFSLSDRPEKPAFENSLPQIRRVCGSIYGSCRRRTAAAGSNSASGRHGDHVQVFVDLVWIDIGSRHPAVKSSSERLHGDTGVRNFFPDDVRSVSAEIGEPLLQKLSPVDRESGILRFSFEVRGVTECFITAPPVFVHGGNGPVFPLQPGFKQSAVVGTEIVIGGFVEKFIIQNGTLAFEFIHSGFPVGTVDLPGIRMKYVVGNPVIDRRLMIGIQRIFAAIFFQDGIVGIEHSLIPGNGSEIDLNRQSEICEIVLRFQMPRGLLCPSIPLFDNPVDKRIGGKRSNGIQSEPLGIFIIQKFFINPVQRGGISGRGSKINVAIPFARLGADDMTDFSIHQKIAVSIGSEGCSDRISQIRGNLLQRPGIFFHGGFFNLSRDRHGGQQQQGNQTFHKTPFFIMDGYG